MRQHTWAAATFLASLLACGPNGGSEPGGADARPGGRDPRRRRRIGRRSGGAGRRGGDRRRTIPAGDGSAAGNDGGTTGGGAGAASACDGLIPRFGAPVIVTRDTGTHAQCDAATTSRSGQVALGTSSISGLAFDLYGAGGVPQNASLAWISDASRHPLLDPWFHSDERWLAGARPRAGDVRRRRSSGAGTPPAPHPGTDRRTSGEQRADGGGGSVVLAAGFNMYTRNGTTPPGGPLRIDWVDAVGVVTRSAVIDGGPNLVLQAWGTKHVFVLDTAPSPWRARWYDEAGRGPPPVGVSATLTGTVRT